MFQFYKNIQTDFLSQVFLELLQSNTQSLFWDTQDILDTNLSRVWFFFIELLYMLTIENRKYDIVLAFNKCQRLTILIHCYFATSCLILDIFVRKKTTYDVNSNKHNIEDFSHANARSESNEMVNHWQF